MVDAAGAVGFIVSDYDRSLALVIDPVLSYSTLLGGSNAEAAIGLAVDSTGAAYVAGFTVARLSDRQSRAELFGRGQRRFCRQAEFRRQRAGIRHLHRRQRRRSGQCRGRWRDGSCVCGRLHDLHEFSFTHSRAAREGKMVSS
jgi:hypothetical protein